MPLSPGTRVVPPQAAKGRPSDLCSAPATELTRRIAGREVSAVEVMTAHLARIHDVNPRLNAIVTLLPEKVLLAEAEKADRAVAAGDPLGPLHGLPVAHKDLTLTRGIRTTFGSPIFADFVPEEDALIVERLHAAGAITIGKTNTPEFGAGSQTFNPVFGPTRNPWDPRRRPAARPPRALARRHPARSGRPHGAHDTVDRVLFVTLTNCRTDLRENDHRYSDGLHRETGSFGNEGQAQPQNLIWRPRRGSGMWPAHLRSHQLHASGHRTRHGELRRLPILRSPAPAKGNASSRTRPQTVGCDASVG